MDCWTGQYADSSGRCSDGHCPVSVSRAYFFICQLERGGASRELTWRRGSGVNNAPSGRDSTRGHAKLHPLPGSFHRGLARRRRECPAPTQAVLASVPNRACRCIMAHCLWGHGPPCCPRHSLPNLLMPASRSSPLLWPCFCVISTVLTAAGASVFTEVSSRYPLRPGIASGQGDDTLCVCRT